MEPQLSVLLKLSIFVHSDLLFLVQLREVESVRQMKGLGPSCSAFFQNNMVLFLFTLPREGGFNWSKSIN